MNAAGVVRHREFPRHVIKWTKIFRRIDAESACRLDAPVPIEAMHRKYIRSILPYHVVCIGDITPSEILSDIYFQKLSYYIHAGIGAHPQAGIDHESGIHTFASRKRRVRSGKEPYRFDIRVEIHTAIAVQQVQTGVIRYEGIFPGRVCFPGVRNPPHIIVRFIPPPYLIAGIISSP